MEASFSEKKETQSGLNIIAIESKRIPNTPEHLRSKIDDLIASFGKKEKNSYHITKVKKDGHVIRARNLLPRHMRKFYGFSNDKLAELTMCHTPTIMWHFPNCHDWDNIYEMDFPKFIEENSKPIADSDIQCGDICLITISYLNPPPGISRRRIVHSCIYVSKDLVFSKNGQGQSVPFLLQKTDDIKNKYSVPNPEAIIRVESRKFMI